MRSHINVVRRGSADDGDERRNGSVIVARKVSTNPGPRRRDDWRDGPISAQAKRCWRVREASNPGPPRRRSQFDTQLDSSSGSQWSICDVVKHARECEDHGRVAVHADVESKGFKRLRRTQCEGGSRTPAVQNIRASRRVASVPQSPDGTPESVNFASGSVPESSVPSSAGHVRRRLVVVQSSRTPVVDVTALDTDTDATPPRVWNEATGQGSDTHPHRRFQVLCSIQPRSCQFGRSQFGDSVSPQSNSDAVSTEVPFWRWSCRERRIEKGFVSGSSS